MGKKIVPVAVTVGLLLLCAAPVEAKMMSLHHVEVTGPGIDGTLSVSRLEFGPIRHAGSPAAIALEGVQSPFEREPRPRGELGPGFVITYVEEFFLDESEIVRLTAYLYPYAEAGPVTYVPGGQRKDPFEPRRETRAGWLSYPERLVENLRAAGLPGREMADRTMQIEPISAGLWVIAGTALAFLLWIVGSGRGGRVAGASG
ncbi:MAG: hypothetical protein ACRDKT_11495 [Actinomycetota bacterium]